MSIVKKHIFWCLISELALNIKECDGLPGREIRKSDGIFRFLGLPDYR